MTFHHPYYIKEMHAHRERQLKQRQLVNEARRAPTATSMQRSAKLAGWPWSGLRRWPAPAK